MSAVLICCLLLVLSPFGSCMVLAETPDSIGIGPEQGRYRPLIGITGYVDLPGEKNLVGQFRCNRTYWSALKRAGAVVVHLLPSDETGIERMLEGLDGVLLCGGPDLDPAVYGDDFVHPTVHKVCRERQDFDLALARKADQAGLPVLGICLGAQLLNVSRGGSLYQDIPAMIGKSVCHRPKDIAVAFRPMHTVLLSADGPLRNIYGRAFLPVNSLHHQAIRKLGRGLVVAARSVGDGVVEAVWDPAKRFFIGLQFHPEFQREPKGMHVPLFERFIAEARRYGLARSERSSRR